MKLNLGCGPLWMHGYLNVDRDGITELAHAARLQGLPTEPAPGVEFLQADLAQQWPWPDASVRKIIADNMLEHFDHTELTHFLAEALRVLEPGAQMVGGVPDFERIWNYYQIGAGWEWEPEWATNGPYKDRAANALQNMAHGWGHQQIFTRPMLEERLARAGFAAEVIPLGMHGLRFTATKTE